MRLDVLSERWVDFPKGRAPLYSVRMIGRGKASFVLGRNKEATRAKAHLRLLKKIVRGTIYNILTRKIQ